jgi:hypothetical protein
MQLDTNAVLAWGGILSFIGLGLWACAEMITGAVKLYCDMAGQRAKERDNG